MALRKLAASNITKVLKQSKGLLLLPDQIQHVIQTTSLHEKEKQHWLHQVIKFAGDPIQLNIRTRQFQSASKPDSYLTEHSRHEKAKHSRHEKAKYSAAEMHFVDITAVLREDSETDEESTATASKKKMSVAKRATLLVNKVLNTKNSREAVYGALDSWVAWEPTFPIAVLKIALHQLEKKEKWHRVVQVIKWMISKGQGMTMGTYRQFVRALEKDNRVEEAHAFWEKKIGTKLNSVPWGFCSYMIDIYERNKMPQRLIKTFRNLEMFNRKPPNKALVEKVAEAYRLLGLEKEKENVLEKYNSIFTSSNSGTLTQNKRKKKKDGPKETKELEALDNGQCSQDILKITGE